jgi:hypothetical protein
VNATPTTTEGSGARPPRSAIVRVGRAAMGERLGGFIYGTIVALSVIAAGARAYPHGPGHVAVLVVITSFVFWLAHVYSHSLGESLARDRRLSVEELTYLARREASMLEAALPPVVALLLGAIGLLSDRTALWAAFGAGLAVLAAQAIVFARTERLGPLATLGVVAVNLSLGVVLVALKLFVSH